MMYDTRRKQCYLTVVGPLNETGDNALILFAVTKEMILK